MTTDESDAPLSDDERIWVSLDRYLAGDAQSADVAVVRQWVSADATRAAILEDLRQIREVAIASHRHRSADEAWRMLLGRLGVEADEATLASPSGVHRGTRARNEHRAAEAAPAGVLRRLGTLVAWTGEARQRARYASAAVLLLAVGSALVVTSRLASTRAVLRSRPPLEASHSFATARGRRGEVRLPDGTRVSLAPESRVTWRSADDSLVREVLLEGEAYFDVVHDSRKPFLVRARNVVIHDIGTRFAVRAYPADSVVRVVVTHGRVRIRAAKAPQTSGATLDPGMVAMVDSAGTTSLQSGADTARYNAFARGQMQFVRTPLRTVVSELERWYDIDIRLGDSTLGSRRITATLDDQTLPDLLVQLSITLNLRVTRAGRLVVLHPD